MGTSKGFLLQLVKQLLKPARGVPLLIIFFLLTQCGTVHASTRNMAIHGMARSTIRSTPIHDMSIRSTAIHDMSIRSTAIHGMSIRSTAIHGMARSTIRSTPIHGMAPPTVSAQYAELFDITHQQLLLDKSATTEAEIASTTKIMTALLVIEAGKLDHSVTIKQDYIDYVNDNNASNAGLQVNDRLTIRQLIYALLLPSGSDAAIALADTLGPGVPRFVEKMNAEALELGLSHTYYVNADGLHNPDSQGHYGYSTAADLARLTAYTLQQFVFRQIVSTQTHTLVATTAHHAYTWTNTNQLLDTYPGTLGVKTGTTASAGYCLVFAARRDGETLLGVILASSSSDQRYADATALLNWGFEHVSE